MHLKKVTTLLLISFLGFSLLGMLPGALAQTPVLKCYSDVSELGDPVSMPDVVGTTFSVAVVVEDVNELYGVDIQFNWTTQWITYTGHEVTIPIDDYPAVQPPSPYAGILYAPYMKLKETVDESASIPLAEPGTMAWIGYSSQAGSPPGGFNGSGTICVFDFVVMNQPYDYEPSATVTLHFILTSLSDPIPSPITHTKEDLEIPLHPRKFAYPPSPMLKVMPEEIFAPTGCLGHTFTVDVYLLGADGGNLHPYWDVAGCDFYLNFNSTLIEALSIDIDPDGGFGAFWSDGTFELVKEIDNPAGYAHVAFIGLAEHTPVFGTIRVAEITFNSTYEHLGYPPPSAPIYLENPLMPSVWYILDAKGEIINLSSPEGTDWTTVYPGSAVGIEYNATSYDDVDGDGELSVGDQIILFNKGTLKWHDYRVDRITGTLGLKEKAFETVDSLLMMDGPTHAYSPWTKPTMGTDAKVWDGYGNANWTGSFWCSYPVASVDYIEVWPQIGAPYNLTEGVDFEVTPEGKINLMRGLDEQVINEFVGTMPDVDLGWPALVNICSSIGNVSDGTGVWVEMPNGTRRYARNYGYYLEPPSEWWFDPDFPYEIESYWASGYPPYSGPWTWPDGTDIYCNYTAPAFVDIYYTTKPDPRTKYVEWPGDYADFLALGDPTGTLWHEVYWVFSTTWNLTFWDDLDTSGDLTAGDIVTIETDGLSITYDVITVSTDIEVVRKPCVQDKVPGDPYYTDPIIVDIAGYPHPDRDMSPWYESMYGLPLPNAVEDAMYTACYKVLGRMIDLYVCKYPDPYGGQGPHNPADMFWPQKEVCLCANVTYNLWPEQQKDVAFEVKDPYGDVYTVLCNRTDEYGVAVVCFRLPWMCEDPEYYFGEWTVTASVDVACEHINDTMTFKYDYMVHIWKVTVDPTSLAHGECFNVTIDYGSWAMQYYNITLTVSALDETGVPFDYGYVWVTVGGAKYCTYANGTASVMLCIPKWARAGRATIHVNALWLGLPQEGGVQQYPLVVEYITIKAE